MDQLYNSLRHEYDDIDRHVVLSRFKGRSKKRKQILAEIDIIAIKGNQIDVFEVKCSRRVVKARKQLHRIKKLLDAKENENKDKKRKVSMYFYYPGLTDVMKIE